MQTVAGRAPQGRRSAGHLADGTVGRAAHPVLSTGWTWAATRLVAIAAALALAYAAVADRRRRMV
ncbi:hypothetical protein [Streptomyces sp. NPDC001502]|uniref:hypothetical protein n=1 Tax=Streptomyces sp. NPDC001502 TaxID=3364578 RepID=UPI0036C78174